MSKAKSVLSENVPEKSSLNDSTPNVPFAITRKVANRNTAPQKPEDSKFDMDLGFHMVRATRHGVRPSVRKFARNGKPYYTKVLDYVEFEDVNTHDKSLMVFEPKKEDSFVYGINRRSDGDFAIKLEPEGVGIDEVDWVCAVEYAKLFPIKMRYDFSQWVDEETGEWKTSKRPKLQLWEASDFENNDEIQWEELE